MRKMLMVTLAMGVAICVATATEWRYSDDMQEHIKTVNAELARAQMEAEFSAGLIGSLHSLTEEANVAAEIATTHEHVHTLKDEILAMRVKKAAENGVTVGGAMRSLIVYWRSVNFGSWAISSPE